MWSWLFIGLIVITCLLCLTSVAQLELKKTSARIWTLLACCSMAVTLTVLFNNHSTEMQEYPYQFKTPNIVLKELKPQEVIEQAPGTVTGELEGNGVTKMVNPRAMVIVNNLNIRDAADINAPLQGNVAYGQIVMIMDNPVDSDWAKIDTGTGIIGWAAKRYLNMLPEEQSGQEPEIKLGG